MQIQEILITLLMATLGSVGFSIIFYTKPKRLPLAAVAGFVTCAVYLLFKHLLGGEFFANFIAAFAGAFLSEILARATKAPVPVYLVPCAIPLVPGSMLYGTMSHFVSGAYAEAGRYAFLTLEVAVGIAGGIIAASVMGLFLRYLLGGRPKNTPRSQENL